MSAPELERSLRSLAVEVEWPPTPELRLQLGPQPAAPQRRRRVLALALVVLLLVAIGVAFAVPSARTAILRFLHLRGATVELVATLPAAEERALGADLGPAVTPAEAEHQVGYRVLLPPGAGRPPVHVAGTTASVLLAGPEPILLMELRTPGPSGPMLFKKVAGSGSGVEWVTVNGQDGIWVPGGHVFIGPNAPPRLAGNSLLWQRGDLTLRLEGKRLTRDAALRLARAIR